MDVGRYVNRITEVHLDNAIHVEVRLEDEVKIILLHKVNALDTDGRTPLMRAATYNTAAVVRLLLERRAEINLQDDQGYTALMYAARSGVVFVLRCI